MSGLGAAFGLIGFFVLAVFGFAFAEYVRAKKLNRGLDEWLIRKEQKLD